MSEKLQEFVERYASALQDYVTGAAEATLERAYHIGRAAIGEGLGVLDLAGAHAQALPAILRQARTPEASVDAARRASEFLVESLSSFEMTHRGFRETIANLRAVNDALRQSEANNLALLSAIPDFVFRIRRDGTYLDAKPGRSGMPAPSVEAVGKKVSEILPTELAERIMSVSRRALETGSIQIFDYQLRENGNLREYEARLVPSGEEEVLGIVRDMTEERRRARARLGLARVAQRIAAAQEVDQALATATSELVTSFDAALARVWVWDEHERVLVLRASAGVFAPTAASGARPDRLALGQSRIGWIAANRRPLWSNALPAEPWAQDLRWAEQEGITAYAGFPLLAADRLVGVMSVLSRRPLGDEDLTALTTVADQLAVAIDHTDVLARLRVTVEQLRVALQLREEFIAAAAHELRTPATTLKAYADLLRKQVGPGPAEPRTVLDAIDRSASRVARLARELVEAAELEHGKLSLEFEPVDLVDLAERAIREAQQENPAHRFYLRSRSTSVVGDPQRIAEVIRRLLDNAVKYQPASGDIDVAVGVEAGEAVLSVRDHGPGIPAERQPYVFEPMYEPLPPGSVGYVGVVGLGLGISKQIIELHRGRIWVESEIGRGSAFHFALPLAEHPTLMTPHSSLVAEGPTMAITYGCPEGDYVSGSPGLCPTHQLPLDLADEPDSTAESAARFTTPAPGCEQSSGRTLLQESEEPEESANE